MECIAVAVDIIKLSDPIEQAQYIAYALPDYSEVAKDWTALQEQLSAFIKQIEVKFCGMLALGCSFNEYQAILHYLLQVPKCSWITQFNLIPLAKEGLKDALDQRARALLSQAAEAGKTQQIIEEMDTLQFFMVEFLSRKRCIELRQCLLTHQDES